MPRSSGNGSTKNPPDESLADLNVDGTSTRNRRQAQYRPHLGRTQVKSPCVRCAQLSRGFANESGFSGERGRHQSTSLDPAVAHSAFALPGPGIQPANEWERGWDREVLGGRHPPLEQQVLRLVVRAEGPIGEGQREKPRDGLVARDVGVVHVVEAIELSPERSESRMFRRVLPPFIGPVLDRVK